MVCMQPSHDDVTWYAYAGDVCYAVSMLQHLCCFIIFLDLCSIEIRKNAYVHIRALRTQRLHDAITTWCSSTRHLKRIHAFMTHIMIKRNHMLMEVAMGQWIYTKKLKHKVTSSVSLHMLHMRNSIRWRTHDENMNLFKSWSEANVMLHVSSVLDWSWSCFTSSHSLAFLYPSSSYSSWRNVISYTSSCTCTY